MFLERKPIVAVSAYTGQGIPALKEMLRELDVRLKNLNDSGRIIQNDSQVHLFRGAAVLLAKVVLFGRDELKPRQTAAAYKCCGSFWA